MRLKNWVAGRSARIFMTLALLCIACWGSYKIWHHLYFRYWLCDLQMEVPGVRLCRWPDITLLNEEELQNIFANPFRYLGQGSQTQAFLSADGQYVLKISHFKYHNPPWFALTPTWWGWSEAKRAEKARKYERWNDTFWRAVRDMPELSGTVYLHLHAGSGPRRMVTLIDRSGISHTLNLRELHCALQRRVTPAEEVIKATWHKGEYVAAQKQLNEIIALVQREGANGWSDEDTGYIHNCGFDAAGVLSHYDIGRLTPLPEEGRKDLITQQVKKVQERLHQWCRKHNISAMNDMK